MKTNIKLMAALHNLYMALAKGKEGNLKELGLTGSEFTILSHLYRKGREKVQKLGEIAMITSGTTTYTIGKLEKNNLIIKKRDIQDKRIFWIELTDNGREFYLRVFDKHMEYMDALKKLATWQYEMAQQKELAEKGIAADIKTGTFQPDDKGTWLDAIKDIVQIGDTVGDSIGKWF